MREGILRGYIAYQSLTGLTSNLTILGRAMASGSDYDESLRAHLSTGHRNPRGQVFSVALEDVTAAADLFRAAWDRTGGADG